MPVCLDDALQAQLSFADSLLSKNPIKAARAISRALRLAFDRVLHFDRLSSPLVENPEEFLAPFRRSAAMMRLTQARGRKLSACQPPEERSLRLLFVTLRNDNFLLEIRESFESAPGVEVRTLDLYDDEARRPILSDIHALVADILAGGSSYRQAVEEWLRPHLDWADTVFIEWCRAQAALVTLIDPGTTRVVVRLHSFEAFSFWPYLVDTSRLDDVVFVSDHLRDTTVALHPRLVDRDGPRLTVLSNALDLARFQGRRKSEMARFTLGLVGIGQVAKDPRWAIEVLRQLRGADERFRLIIVGSDLNAKASAAACRYHNLLQKDLAYLEPCGAIVRIDQTDDVSNVLQDIGIILSSSVRESFHCALVEGAASGAVPVVRDWPFFAGKPHGARTLFPDDWVVGSPEEAVERILVVTRSRDYWQRESEAAAAYAIAKWDWGTVRKDIDRFLLG